MTIRQTIEAEILTLIAQRAEIDARILHGKSMLRGIALDEQERAQLAASVRTAPEIVTPGAVEAAGGVN